MRRVIRIAVLAVLVFWHPLSAAESDGELKIYRYDIETETEVTGTLNDVHEAHWYDAKETNLLATMTLDDGSSLIVDLGMTSLYENEIENGRRATILGSRFQVDEQPHLLARTVKLENSPTVRVRNARGVPHWLDHSNRIHRQSFHYRMNRMRRR